MSSPIERRPARGSHADPATRDAVLRQHLGLVYHVAHQLSRAPSSDVEIDAFEHFDASRGLAFSTFATPRIRGAMLDEMRRLDRVPRSVRRKAREIDGVAMTLAGALGREPNHDELAEGLGIDMATLWRC